MGEERVASLVLRFHLCVCVCVCAFAQLVYQTLLQLGKHSRRRLCSRFSLSRSWIGVGVGVQSAAAVAPPPAN